jgi:phosphate butyryltransferase
MRYTGFENLIERAKSLSCAKVAVAAAADKEVLEAVKLAQEGGFIEPILVGDEQKIISIAQEIGLDLNQCQIIQETDSEQAAHKAVDAVIDGKAHFLMKGLINTGDFLRAVLRPKRGLKTGRLLSHLGAFEVPGFPHLFFLTDGGMNIAPNLEQKKEILTSTLEYLHSIGMETVKVVLLGANEVPSPKMPATMDAHALSEMNQKGSFPGAIVEGPLALDGAVSAAALRHKGIQSEINGDADVFLVPTIEVGNVLGKSLVYFAGGMMAGIILGAQVPIVLTSRNDPPRSKLMSILMASLSRK